VTALLPWLAGAALAALGLLLLHARRRSAAGGEAIRLVTSRYLGGKRFLTIVEVDGQRLLLGLGGEHVSLVARLGAGAGAGVSPSASRGPAVRIQAGDATTSERDTRPTSRRGTPRPPCAAERA
jgi:flagellar biogenesis protein FliO